MGRRRAPAGPPAHAITADDLRFARALAARFSRGHRRVRFTGYDEEVNAVSVEGGQVDAAVRSDVLAAVAGLAPVHAALVVRLLDGETLEDAGASIGISKSWACRRHKAAIEALRARLVPEAA